MTWSERPAFLSPMSPLVLTSNFVWLERIFEMMIESDSPAFFKDTSESFMSTSCAVSEVALKRVSATTASTSVCRSRYEPIMRSSRSRLL
jgi:hypothetical protein